MVVFWGTHVKPGRTYTLPSRTGRLRISQATLAIGTATRGIYVQCETGFKDPVLICSLLPEKTESLQLDLEFDEAEDVVFSVIGPRGVYLTGYYVSHNNMQDVSESFGMDIESSETYESNNSSDDYDYKDSFINDDDDDESESPASSNKDDDNDKLGYLINNRNGNGNGNGRFKRLKKKYQSADHESEEILKVSYLVEELQVNKELLVEVEKQPKKVNVEAKGDVPFADENAQGDEVFSSADVGSEKNLKPKKKRKGCSEVNSDSTDNNLLAGSKPDDDQHAINTSSGFDSNQIANGNQSDEKMVKKKSIKVSKTQEIDGNTNIFVEKESPTEPDSCKKRTLSRGLVIEDLVIGNSNGKVAAAGRKVIVNCVVKLKEDGQVISSNGSNTHKFQLGDNEVIEGLNVGLEGMRVGDKRRLTIPPSMSLGYNRDGENVPQDSWLVFDVEMTSIH